MGKLRGHQIIVFGELIILLGRVGLSAPGGSLDWDNIDCVPCTCGQKWRLNKDGKAFFR
jgi:hypothetical protein